MGFILQVWLLHLDYLSGLYGLVSFSGCDAQVLFFIFFVGYDIPLVIVMAMIAMSSFATLFKNMNVLDRRGKE